MNLRVTALNSLLTLSWDLVISFMGLPQINVLRQLAVPWVHVKIAKAAGPGGEVPGQIHLKLTSLKTFHQLRMKFSTHQSVLACHHIDFSGRFG